MINSHKPTGASRASRVDQSLATSTLCPVRFPGRTVPTHQQSPPCKVQKGMHQYKRHAHEATTRADISSANTATQHEFIFAGSPLSTRCDPHKHSVSRSTRTCSQCSAKTPGLQIDEGHSIRLKQKTDSGCSDTHIVSGILDAESEPEPAAGWTDQLTRHLLTHCALYRV